MREKQKREVRTTILLTPDERTRFQAAADREGVTLSTFIRLATNRLTSVSDVMFTAGATGIAAPVKQLE